MKSSPLSWGAMTRLLLGEHPCATELVSAQESIIAYLFRLEAVKLKKMLQIKKKQLFNHYISCNTMCGIQYMAFHTCAKP